MKTLFSRSLAEKRLFAQEVVYLKTFSPETALPLMRQAGSTLPLARRVYDHPGLIINPKTHMAWRPYENLINRELDNRTPGKVTGWMRFFRFGKRPLKVRFDLNGDFHDDIRGKVISLSNPAHSHRNGTVGTISMVSRAQRHSLDLWTGTTACLSLVLAIHSGHAGIPVPNSGFLADLA